MSDYCYDEDCDECTEWDPYDWYDCDRCLGTHEMREGEYPCGEEYLCVRCDEWHYFTEKPCVKTDDCGGLMSQKR